MKKISLFVISILLIVPMSVLAAEINVKTLKATATGTTINYNGTMEDGSYAVMCKLYKDDEELDLLSSAVENNSFEGSFTAPSSGEYKVYCANYEGGEIKSVDVTVKNNKTETVEETTTEEVKTDDVVATKTSVKEEDKKSNPKTYDGIMIFVSLLVVAIIGFTVTVFLKKRKVNC